MPYELNAGANCVVVSVDYRLGPEEPYPAAVEDAEESLHWVVSHAQELNVNLAKYAVGGSSRFATFLSPINHGAYQPMPPAEGTWQRYSLTKLR